MKFNDLIIHNFLTVGSAHLNLADRGLNVIQGVNEEDSSATSNGSGKSSVVDALCWCLYGVTARGAKGDAVVNNIEGKNTRVMVELKVGATTYNVARHRKHSTGKNQLHINVVSEGAATRLDKGTESETQIVLEKILGCSYDVFVAAVYAGQEIMPDLPKMTDRELKRLIEEAAGLQRIERAYQLARTTMTGKSTEATLLANRLAGVNNQIDKLGVRISDTRAKSDLWEAGRTSRVAAARDVCTEANLRAHKADATAVELAVPFIDDAIASLVAKLGEHRSIAAAAKVARDAYIKAEREIQRSKLEAGVMRIKEIQKKIADAPGHMAENCKECGKPHSPAELDDYVATQGVNLREAHAALADLKVVVRAEMDKAIALKTAADDAEALIPDVTAVSKELENLRSKQRAHAEAVNAAGLAVLARDRASRDMKNVELEENSHLALIELMNKELEDLKVEATTVHLSVVEAARAHQVAEQVVKLFGPAGVRAQILDNVTPYLNDRTSEYLSVLSDGNMTAIWTTLTKSSSGDLKEKFSIDVSNRTGASDFTGLSGGEKRKVRLSCALALQDLVASRATQPIDLWIGDEIDDALDDAGLERLMTILERKARDKGTVLVISHNSLSDWCDSVTTVTKRAGKSVVEGALVAA